MANGETSFIPQCLPVWTMYKHCLLQCLYIIYHNVLTLNGETSFISKALVVRFCLPRFNILLVFLASSNDMAGSV